MTAQERDSILRIGFSLAVAFALGASAACFALGPRVTVVKPVCSSERPTATLTFPDAPAMDALAGILIGVALASRKLIQGGGRRARSG